MDRYTCPECGGDGYLVGQTVDGRGLDCDCSEECEHCRGCGEVSAYDAIDRELWDELRTEVNRSWLNAQLRAMGFVAWAKYDETEGPMPVKAEDVESYSVVEWIVERAA